MHQLYRIARGHTYVHAYIGMHVHILAEHVTRLAKKLVTRLAAVLARIPDIRSLQQNRLPLQSAYGQF